MFLYQKAGLKFKYYQKIEFYLQFGLSVVLVFKLLKSNYILTISIGFNV